MPETIEAPCGAIRGRRRGGILHCLGIPYAEAPVGEHRFAPPRRKAVFEGGLDAVAYGPSAPQRRVLPEALAKIAGTPAASTRTA